MNYQVSGLNKLAKQLNDFVKGAGFDEAETPLRIALIHSEVSEAFEAFRKDRYANIGEYLEGVMLSGDNTDTFLRSP